MELNSYFTDLLSNIRPTEAQTKELQEAHTRLRKRLLEDEFLGPMIVSVFLQGSYRRSNFPSVPWGTTSWTWTWSPSLVSAARTTRWRTT